MQKSLPKRCFTSLLSLFLSLLMGCSPITSEIAVDIKAQTSAIESNENDLEDEQGLLSFLTWFVNWNAGRPSGNREVYDAGYVQDPSMNILANIVSCPGCYNFKDHPELAQPEYKVGTDPRGWGFSGEYYIFDGPATDWVAKQLFHVPPEDLDDLLAQGEAQRLIYKEESENGYQYISPNASGIGGVLPSARLQSANKQGNKLAVVFDMVYPPMTGLAPVGPYYAEVEYVKDRDGQSGYWSLYRYMKGVTSWPGYQGFRDIDLNAWSFPGVKYAIDHKIMTGFNPVRFAPQAKCDRAMIATILYRLEQQPNISITSPFADVKEEDYFYKPAIWAYENGIMTGYESGNFGPADPISREQMAAVLYRYAKYKGLDVSLQDPLTGFSDAENISFYALPAMQWAVAAGLIKGLNEIELAPQAGADRAQIATILERFSRFNSR